MSQHIAQLNLARLRAALDAHCMAGFVDGLQRVNAAADAHPGFVWRLKSAEGNALAFQPLGPEIVVNLSVWRDLESFCAYVYAGAHRDDLRRRREWFVPMSTAHVVLWQIAAGHRPTLDEALSMHRRYLAEGASPGLFGQRELAGLRTTGLAPTPALGV